MPNAWIVSILLVLVASTAPMPAFALRTNLFKKHSTWLRRKDGDVVLDVRIWWNEMMAVSAPKPLEYVTANIEQVTI